MTRIVFRRRDGIFYGFDEYGHTEYGESGDDVLCAALSAMTMLIMNTIEVSYASDIEYTIAEDSANISFTARGALPEFEDDERKRYAIGGLIMGYFYQLNDLVEEYYEFLEVDVCDDENESLQHNNKEI